MIIIVAAIAGPLWITTEEKIPWMAVNSTLYNRYNNFTVSYIVKSSNASLWILCTRQGLSFCLFESLQIFNFLLRQRRIWHFSPRRRQKRKNHFVQVLFLVRLQSDHKRRKKMKFPIWMKRREKIKLTPLERLKGIFTFCSSFLKRFLRNMP